MAPTDQIVSRPILVVGTHRSGTTLLGRALGHHPEVAYWEEPRHVWSYGNNFKPDDVLTAGDAAPRTKAAIRRKFGRYLKSSGRVRLAEKTPSNCLRLSFILEVFPAALFIHIHRDGRAVVHSTDVVTRTRIPERRWYARRLFGTPVWEWPALLPRAWRVLGRRLLGGKMAYWGPQPSGWRRWLERDERMAVLAKQWRYTIEPVLEFRAGMPASQWLDIGYEDLVNNPVHWAHEIERFAGLSPSPAFQSHLVGECRRDRVDAWRSKLDEDLLERLRPILEPTNGRLGYEW